MSCSGHPYISGEVLASRFDPEVLGLKPLALQDQGLWDPDEHYWGEDDEPLEPWARKIHDHGPRRAFEFETGVGIGRLSLGPGFQGLLPWGCLDNRPFMRIMHGYGLCLWREGRIEEAGNIFNEMLWLNPSDNQGARFLLGAQAAGRTWEEFQENEAE